MNIDKPIEFCKFFKSIVKKVNEEVSTKNEILRFKDILYCCLYMNGNSYSYSLANMHMYMDNIIDVSDCALIKRRKTISHIHFKKIRNGILNFIYKNNNTPRIIGVDGTYIPLSINLKKYGFPCTTTNTFCTGLISSLFDLDRKVVINYRLRKNHDERKALISQLKYLQPGDILIMDRGYYSCDLLFLLNKRKIQVIFRMKKNMLMIKQIIEKGQTSMNTTIYHQGISLKFRIIVYEINGNNYYLGTTIMNHKVEYFKNLYWQRWNIETHFRESKYLFSLSNILSRNENKVRQDVCAHNILFLFNAIFRNHIQNMLTTDHLVNSSSLFSMVTNKVLHLILYNKITVPTKEYIEKLCLRLLKTPTIRDPDRHYERIRKKPIGKWYYTIIHGVKLIQP